MSVAAEQMGRRDELGLVRLKPVVAKQFAGMGSTDRPVAATKILSGTILVTSPADTFGMFGMERDFRFRLPRTRVAHESSVKKRRPGNDDISHTFPRRASGRDGGRWSRC